MIDKGEIIHLLFFIRQIHPVQITLASLFRQSGKQIVANKPAIQRDHVGIVSGITLLRNKYTVYLRSFYMLILNMIIFKSRILSHNNFRGIIQQETIIGKRVITN